MGIVRDSGGYPAEESDDDEPGGCEEGENDYDYDYDYDYDEEREPSIILLIVIVIVIVIVLITSDPNAKSNRDTIREMKSLFRYTAPPHPCGYLPAESSSLEYEMVADLSAAEYQVRLDEGWRRFGGMMFRPQCHNARRVKPCVST